MIIRYPAKVEPQEEGGLFVQFVDLSEAFTEGDTEEEALFNAAEVLSSMLAIRIEEGKDVPLPSKMKGAQYVAPDAKTQAALLIHFTRGDRPLADLARALDTSWPAAARLENPKHWPSLRQLERAAAALGKRLILSFE